MAHQPGWSQRVATGLRSAITASGLSVRSLSEITGIPLSTLNRRVRGFAPWDTAQIEAVAEAIQCDPKDLIPSDDAEAEAS
ncbi:helix-turn-helix domain-containing protein [Nocardia abscessus]|uniref:helix-turn-helix domain-containing protein n=1 Tax=Nocardia abscessus TaxID=120957 RepID=UPI000A0323CC|nr:helix-turn-helix domain-containing protein [Nocardia abscessus]